MTAAGGRNSLSNVLECSQFTGNGSLTYQNNNSAEDLAGHFRPVQKLVTSAGSNALHFEVTSSVMHYYLPEITLSVTTN